MQDTVTAENVASSQHVEADPWEFGRIIYNFDVSIGTEPDEPFYEFHFGALEDRIEWDDQNFSHLDIWPFVTVSVNFSTLSSGRVQYLTPTEISHFLFAGRAGRRIYDNIEKVIGLEKERWADDPNSEMHLNEMGKIMRRVQKAFVRRVLRAADKGRLVAQFRHQYRWNDV